MQKKQKIKKWKTIMDGLLVLSIFWTPIVLYGFMGQHSAWLMVWFFFLLPKLFE